MNEPNAIWAPFAVFLPSRYFSFRIQIIFTASAAPAYAHKLHTCFMKRYHGYTCWSSLTIPGPNLSPGVLWDSSRTLALAAVRSPTSACGADQTTECLRLPSRSQPTVLMSRLSVTGGQSPGALITHRSGVSRPAAPSGRSCHPARRPGPKHCTTARPHRVSGISSLPGRSCQLVMVCVCVCVVSGVVSLACADRVMSGVPLAVAMRQAAVW